MIKMVFLISFLFFVIAGCGSKVTRRTKGSFFGNIRLSRCRIGKPFEWEKQFMSGCRNYMPEF
jgi:hypothetical protein